MLAFALACSLVRELPTVSYSTGGAPVEVILRELSKSSGIPLHAADRVRGEILIVEAKDVPLEDLMTRIADADGAEWKRDGDGYELTRSMKLIDSQTAAELALRTAQVSKGLANHLAIELAPPAKNAPPANAADRMAWRAAQALGPAVLARVKNGTRTVYSTDPSALQKKWPGNFQSIAQAYVQEVKGLPPQIAPPNLRTDATNISRALVALTSSMFEGLTVHVYLFGPGGQFIVDGRASMMPPDLEALEKSMDAKAPKASGAPLKLSETATEFAELARKSAGGQPVKITADMQAKILDPAKYDPLSLFVADGLDQVAKAHSRSLVASVPDLCFLTGIFLSSTGVTESSILNWIGSTSDIDESHPGWMTIKPKFPVDVRELRVDREKMGAFYRSAWKNGGVTLAELGAYVATQPRRYPETISLFYAFFCMPEVARMFDPDGLGAIRVFGTLTADQRVQLEAQREIPYAALSPATRRELDDWIYNGKAYSFGSHEYDPEYIDPTDAFPNGITMPSMIRAQIAGEDAVLPIFAGDTTDLNQGSLSATSLGYLLGRYDLGEARSQAPVTAFRLGKDISCRVEFGSPHYTQRATLHETRFDRNAKPVALTELPTAFLEAVKRARAEYSRSRNDEERQQKTPPPN